MSTVSAVVTSTFMRSGNTMICVSLFEPPFAVDRTEVGGEVSTTAPVVPDTAADALDTINTRKTVSAVHAVIARRTGLAILPVEQEAMAMERPPSP
jgi:hypothetical protein